MYRVHKKILQQQCGEKVFVKPAIRISSDYQMLMAKPTTIAAVLLFFFFSNFGEVNKIIALYYVNSYFNMCPQHCEISDMIADFKGFKQNFSQSEIPRIFNDPQAG